MGTLGVVFMVWKPGRAQRVEGGVESLRGTVPRPLSWEGAGRLSLDPVGRAAGWPVTAQKEKCAKVGQKGKLSQEGVPPPRRPQAGAQRAPSAAPGGTPLHVARLAEETVVQRVAALVRGLHRQQGPAVLRETRHERWTPGLSAAARGRGLC